MEKAILPLDVEREISPVELANWVDDFSNNFCYVCIYIETILGQEYPPFYVDIEDCFADMKTGKKSNAVLQQAYIDLFEAISKYSDKKISRPSSFEDCQNLIDLFHKLHE